MRVIEDIDSNEVIKEDIVITNFSTFRTRGIVNGNVHVEDGSTLLLHGTLNGDLLTAQNSVSYIHGTMNGSILPSEGKIELSGMLNTKSSVPENVVKIEGCYINKIKY